MKFSYAGSENCPVIDPIYLNNLLIDAERILETAIAAPSQEKMQYWFGERNFKNGAKGDETVKLHTISIRDYLSAHAVAFIAKDVPSGAFANQQEPHEADPSPDSSSSTSATPPGRRKLPCRIYLGRWFGMNIFNLAERLVTFFHEVSHRTPGLETRDILYNEAPAYRTTCIQLAKSQRFTDALRNAENWGYYLTSYAQAARITRPDRPDDWSFVKNENEIARKPPAKMAGEVRLTPDPAMHLAGKTWTIARGKRQGEVNDEDVPCVELGGHLVYEFVMHHDVMEKKLLNGDTVAQPTGE